MNANLELIKNEIIADSEELNSSKVNLFHLTSVSITSFSGLQYGWINILVTKYPIIKPKIINSNNKLANIINNITYHSITLTHL